MNRHVATARREAISAAKSSGLPLAFGVQINDVTGRLEPGFIHCRWAEAPGMLHEVHGIAYPNGTVETRADVTPAWRKAGAK